MQTTWSISYTQSDVDTIREQIVQDENAKRHWLLLALLITIGGLALTVTLLSTSYALYARATSERDELAAENATLKKQGAEAQQQIEALSAREAKEAEARALSQAMLDRLRQQVLDIGASPNQAANFARMVYDLPGHQVELAAKPPDKVFRNWKITNGSTTEIYTLVGGFVDGKWIAYSNLVARR